MLWLPENLPMRRRLRERGPELTSTCRDHGRPSKSYKIPSVHVIPMLIANGREATAPY
jgi:hypothetical protein